MITKKLKSSAEMLGQVITKMESYQMGNLHGDNYFLVKYRTKNADQELTRIAVLSGNSNDMKIIQEIDI